MADTINSYAIVNFNCKSLKRSIECIRTLCKTCDIIILQETWLLDYEIPLLGTIDDDFGYTGKSAVDSSAGILRGRPFGGVAILWRKTIFHSVSVVSCDSDRLAAIKVEVADRALLYFSVYMPTNSVDNLAEFTECLSEVCAIIDSIEVEAVFILGDFNAHPGELFYTELLDFCNEQRWRCADMEILGIAHQLAGLPSGEWGALARHYPPPLLPGHAHFTPHVLPPAHAQPHAPPPHDTDVTSDNPTTMRAHSTTSPATSRPSSPQSDDISVTASCSPPPDERPGAFTSVTRTRKPLQPLPAAHSSLFHSALAAQLFLNSPLLPTPPAWLYSQLYGGYDWWLRPPPPQEDSNHSSPDREEEATSTPSSAGKKRPASPEWTEQGVRTRSKALTTSERRPVDVWRPY